MEQSQLETYEHHLLSSKMPIQSSLFLHPKFALTKDCLDHTKTKNETKHDENIMDLDDNVDSDCEMQSRHIKKWKEKAQHHVIA